MKLLAPNHLVLSRRNLLVLLAKLDGHPVGSARTIVGGEDAPGFFVSAEEDTEHYVGREPGRMHADSEARLGEPRP